MLDFPANILPDLDKSVKKKFGIIEEILTGASLASSVLVTCDKRLFWLYRTELIPVLIDLLDGIGDIVHILFGAEQRT